MGKHICAIGVSVFFMISALALTLVSIYFDYWYEIDASGNTNSTIKNEYSYRYGMWRKCYLLEIPTSMYISKDIDTGVNINNLILWRHSKRHAIEKHAEEITIYPNNIYIILKFLLSFNYCHFEHLDHTLISCHDELGNTTIIIELIKQC